jgi:hypothetical protein
MLKLAFTFLLLIANVAAHGGVIGYKINGQYVKG